MLLSSGPGAPVDASLTNGRTPLSGWLMLREILRCVPLLPKYPMVTARSRATSRWILRFHDCTYGLWKSESTLLGARPAAAATVAAFWNVMAPVNVRGSARGGFDVTGVTTLVTGSSARTA